MSFEWYQISYHFQFFKPFWEGNLQLGSFDYIKFVNQGFEEFQELTKGKAIIYQTVHRVLLFISNNCWLFGQFTI